VTDPDALPPAIPGYLADALDRRFPRPNPADENWYPDQRDRNAAAEAMWRAAPYLGDRDDVVHVLWPYDGPYSHDSLVQAAHAFSALVRYENNATQESKGTLGWASTVAGIVSGLHAGVAGLNQLTTQLAVSLLDQANNPTLYDNRRSPEHPADETARRGAVQLQEARQALQVAAEKLAAAHQTANRLGNEEPAAEQNR
jgi:hypothetical protein